MPRIRSEHYDDIKRNILRAAAKLFAKKGFANTNIIEIGKACKASKSRMYHYFDSKGDILAAMLLDHAQGLIEAARVVIEAGGPSEERLTRYIATHFAYYLDNPHPQAVLLHDAAYLQPADAARLRRLERQLMVMLSTLLVEISGKDKWSRPVATTHAMLIYGMLNWIYTWYSARGPVKPDQLARYAANLCLHGLGTGRPRDAPMTQSSSTAPPR